jgi:hypothetical protein
MGFMNKGDVKNHLSPRQRNGKRLYRPVGPSDASGYLGQKLRRAGSVLAIAAAPLLPDTDEAVPTENTAKSVQAQIPTAPIRVQA